ncbi:MAG: Trk system potassium transporter TrkA [Desulfobacterales bacterium]|nr:Trk system potassium transporter TrkA [Desulfobacterales bacterium]
MKIVIVGAGEVGFHIASRLSLENKDVVVVDTSNEALKRVSENLDVQVVKGSGSSPEVLIDAGIKTADILLAVTDSDEANLVACLTCDILSPATKKLARIRLADYDAYHKHFSESAPHINTIINPEIEVVKTIYRLMRVPGSVDVGEFEGGRVKIVGMRLDEESVLAGLKLAELPSRVGGVRPLIAAIVRNGVLIIPHGGDTLKAGDLVYFISEESKMNEVLHLFNRRMKPVKRVLIVGGGRIGSRLADFLESKHIHTKIVEKDTARCRVLAERMNRAVVLCGDGSDQGLLVEENIKDMDVVVSLTDDEETNILVSLLAKSMGAENTITKISKFSYFPLMGTIGVEQVVSPRLSAIDSILQHIRKGKVLSAVSVHGEQAEVIEAVALQTSEIVDTPISKVSFPKGALLICILRDEEVIIPTGESVIRPDDRVIIFATREAVPRIEKMLTVKLEFF